MVTALILIGLAVWLVLALRAIQKGKTGGCSGDCAHCGSSCGRDGCGK